MKKTYNVALGFGNNVDYEIRWNTKTLEDLILSNGITLSDIHGYESINSATELIGSILYYMSQGLGKEIYISGIDIVEEFASHFEKRVTLGGTPIRAALVMDKMEKGAYLHMVTMNDDVRTGLPQNSCCIHSQTEDTSYPHLVVQYKKGDHIHVGEIDIVAKESNRLIYTHDPDNKLLPIAENFGELVKNVKVFLVTGFNLMDDMEILNERIDSVKSMIDKLSPDSIVYLESSCYFHPEYETHVLRQLEGEITVFSMNEEEFQEQAGYPIDILQPDQVLKAMDRIQGTLHIPYLLVHTHCWTAIKGENACRFQEAMQSATQMATTRYRFGDSFSKEDFASTALLPCSRTVTEFCNNMNGYKDNTVSCIPVPEVPETHITTIGLGDSFVGGFMLPYA